MSTIESSDGQIPNTKGFMTTESEPEPEPDIPNYLNHTLTNRVYAIHLFHIPTHTA